MAVALLGGAILAGACSSSLPPRCRGDFDCGLWEHCEAGGCVHEEPACPPDFPDCLEPPACTEDADCEDHFCCFAPERGPASCQFCPRTCSADFECCPGQVCNEGLGRCFDKFDECRDGDDCFPDRVCSVDCPAGECPPGDSGRCDYVRCSGNSDCAAGQGCFLGRCMSEPPCHGACGYLEVCVLANNRCRSDPGCTDGPCDEGFLMVYDDPDNVWDDAPRCSDHGCHCERLPPL